MASGGRHVHGTEMSRRTWIQTVAASAAGGAAGALIADGVVVVAKLAFDAAMMHSRQASAASDALDVAAGIFGDIRFSNALPGAQNIDFTAGEVHPDIQTPFQQLAALIHDSGREIVAVDPADMAVSALEEQILLLGGPVSNAVARSWQGYTQDPVSGIYLHQGGLVPRRWRFEYDLDKATAPRPKRYVNRDLKESWPQALVDEADPSRRLFAGIDSAGMLREDRLLLTFARNPFSKSGSTMLDVSDLHGPGNEAFVQIVSSTKHLESLANALGRAGVGPSRSFQALYTVYVEHDHERRATRVAGIAGPEVAAID